MKTTKCCGDVVTGNRASYQSCCCVYSVMTVPDQVSEYSNYRSRINYILLLSFHKAGAYFCDVSKIEITSTADGVYGYLDVWYTIQFNSFVRFGYCCGWIFLSPINTLAVSFWTRCCGEYTESLCFRIINFHLVHSHPIRHKCMARLCIHCLSHTMTRLSMWNPVQYTQSASARISNSVSISRHPRFPNPRYKNGNNTQTSSTDHWQ